MKVTPQIEMLLMLSMNELRTAAQYHSVKMGSRSIYAIICDIEERVDQIEKAKVQWKKERDEKERVSNE
jgi:hypothetical protein